MNLRKQIEKIIEEESDHIGRLIDYKSIGVRVVKLIKKGQTFNNVIKKEFKDYKPSEEPTHKRY